MADELHLWLWEITDEITGRRRRTRHRMTEKEARARHGEDARKVEGTLEIRTDDIGTHLGHLQRGAKD